MRVSNISPFLYNKNKTLLNLNHAFSTQKVLFNYEQNSDFISFSGKENDNYTKRKRQLDRLGVSDEGIERISKYSDKRYAQALNLLKKGCYEENIEKASRYRKKNFNKALTLLKNNIFDLSLTSLVKLKDNKFNRILDLVKKGIDSDCLELYSRLNEKEYKNSVSLMQNGHSPIRAVYLSRLPQSHKAEFIKLLDSGISPEDAYDIVFQDDDNMNNTLKYLEQGIDACEVVHYNELSDKEKARADRLMSMNISDCASIDIAELSDDDYMSAQSMIKDCVYPEYITDIIGIENGLNPVPEYNEYRSKDYSRTSSYSIAMLSDCEFDDLDYLIEIHPQIKELFKDEYRIEIVHFQNTDEVEGILTKEMHLDNGTKITLVQTFNENGDTTQSRTEETINHETFSFQPEKSDIYRVKYNKLGDIREMKRFIVSPEKKGIIGVEHLQESPIMPGVFDSTFYDIKDFKTDGTDEHIDDDIQTSVCSKGIPISRVEIDKDGTITYKESFSLRNATSIREYKELNDSEGNPVYTFYSYKIFDEDKKTLMNIERSFARNKDGSTTNIINGIEYHINYDDKNRNITITDGEHSKNLKFKNKLPFYHADKIWQNIKNLQVDNLLVLDKRIKHWNYCEEKDSVANNYSQTISTGQDMSIISHEIGHIINFANGKISRDEDFLNIYTEEMDDFLYCAPNNEQEFVLYFTPKSEIEGGADSDGADEFVAETNMILSVYGATKNNLKTRSQFLVRYFPRSIAKVAELAGKTSTKSLLDEQ
ncbi:hypothetical protein IJ182_08995 [bacterium]|nr:hypothetical protein [bacterium]